MSDRLRRWHVLATVAVVVLGAVSALLGLFRPGHYRDAPALVELYRVQDLTILAVGLPVLAAGLWYARRGSLRGRVVWLGALAYTAYTWASIGVQVTFNELFLVYVALFTLSLFTLVGGLVTTDAESVRRAIESRISPRVYGGLLVVIALGLASLWLAEIVPALLDGTVPLAVREQGPQATFSHFLDLGVVVPAILLSAAWLVRRRPWGYVLAGVVLVLGTMLSVPISLMTIVLLAGDAVTVTPVAALFSFLPPILAGGLTLTYLRAMGGRRGGPASEDRRRSA
jgi:uncharacterized membrane protein YGL010W